MAISVTVVAFNFKMSYRPQGGTLIEKYCVKGLDPSQSNNYVAALQAVDSVTGLRIPAYQLPHPTIVGFSVMGYDSGMMGTDWSPARDGVFIDVVYGTPEFLPNTTLIEITGIDSMKTVNYWPFGPLQGEPIIVAANINTDGTINRGASIESRIDPTTISGRLPQIIYQPADDVPMLSGGIIIKFTRRENTAPDILNIRRRTNSGPWQGLSAGQWLLRNVTARNIVGVGSIFPGGGYEVSYLAQSCDEPNLPPPIGGFVYTALYRDPFTGTTIIGVDPLDGSNNGYTNVELYPGGDFDALGLPNVYTNGPNFALQRVRT